MIRARILRQIPRKAQRDPIDEIFFFGIPMKSISVSPREGCVAILQADEVSNKCAVYPPPPPPPLPLPLPLQNFGGRWICTLPETARDCCPHLVPKRINFENPTVTLSRPIRSPHTPGASGVPLLSFSDADRPGGQRRRRGESCGGNAGAAAAGVQQSRARARGSGRGDTCTGGPGERWGGRKRASSGEGPGNEEEMEGPLSRFFRCRFELSGVDGACCGSWRCGLFFFQVANVTEADNIFAGWEWNGV